MASGVDKKSEWTEKWLLNFSITCFMLAFLAVLPLYLLLQTFRKFSSNWYSEMKSSFNPFYPYFSLVRLSFLNNFSSFVCWVLLLSLEFRIIFHKNNFQGLKLFDSFFPIIMGGRNLKICQNFVGTKFFLTFVGR